MKIKKMYPLCLAATLFLTVPCTHTVFAEERSLTTNIVDAMYKNIQPRFAYIEDAYISINPNAQKIIYSIYVGGISEVTSISGQLTIYKANTSGHYTKIYSKKLTSNKSVLSVDSSIPSQGKGDYKIAFSGTIYTKSGSETIDMDETDSF